ncbi:hypothetical protein GOV12_01230 [Candidatus Pacearchaeota archaeon]|nr:hypothetical protein [Candidatus Pacearchaeota archaeon]
MQKTLETHSASEFTNPFFVMVHTKNAYSDRHMRKKGSFVRTLANIETYKRNYDHITIDDLTSPDTIPPNLPKNRPILVCGFFKDICVKDQRDALVKAGYDAYISREGSY